VVLGAQPVGGEPVVVLAGLLGELELADIGQPQLLGGEQAGLDALGELDLLLGVEQRDSADLLEVGPDQVGGRPGGVLLGDDDLVLVLLVDQLASGSTGSPSLEAGTATAATSVTGSAAAFAPRLRGAGVSSTVGSGSSTTATARLAAGALAAVLRPVAVLAAGFAAASALVDRAFA
jgi:hypothetical protein